LDVSILRSKKPHTRSKSLFPKGDYGTVEANVTIFDANQRMYNLTVEDAHTFFVGDGDWLVHNVDCDFWLDNNNLTVVPDPKLNKFNPKGQAGSAIATYKNNGRLNQIAMYDYDGNLRYTVEYDGGQGWHAHYIPDSGFIESGHTNSNHINFGGDFGTPSDLQEFLGSRGFDNVDWGAITFPPSS